GSCDRFTGGGLVGRAVDADGPYGAGRGRPLQGVPQTFAGGLRVDEVVITVEREDLGSSESALPMALAQVHVHMDSHGRSSRFRRPGRRVVGRLGPEGSGVET